MSERTRYRVVEVRYSVQWRAAGAEATWLVYLSPLDGPQAACYVLRQAGEPPLPAPPYARGDEVELDSRLLTPVRERP